MFVLIKRCQAKTCGVLIMNFPIKIICFGTHSDTGMFKGFFQTIRSLLWWVMYSDEVTKNKSKLDVAKILIWIEIQDVINYLTKVHIDGLIFEIKMVEDESKDCVNYLFCRSNQNIFNIGFDDYDEMDPSTLPDRRVQGGFGKKWLGILNFQNSILQSIWTKQRGKRHFEKFGPRGDNSISYGPIHGFGPNGAQ